VPGSGSWLLNGRGFTLNFPRRALHNALPTIKQYETTIFQHPGDTLLKVDDFSSCVALLARFGLLGLQSLNFLLAGPPGRPPGRRLACLLPIAREGSVSTTFKHCQLEIAQSSNYKQSSWIDFHFWYSS